MKNKLDKAPFSFLPEMAIEHLLSHFSSETAKKGTLLLIQEISSIEKFLVLSQGSAQYYFEQNNEKTLQGRLEEGDNFGGLSILLNDAVAIRTLKVLEDSVFLSLDADIFLKTCAEFKDFKAFFTNAFGALMLNKSYAGIIARQIKDKEFNLPFFNQPISAIFRPNIVTCPHDATIHEAAQKMAKNNSSGIPSLYLFLTNYSEKDGKTRKRNSGISLIKNTSNNETSFWMNHTIIVNLQLFDKSGFALRYNRLVRVGSQ